MQAGFEVTDVQCSRRHCTGSCEHWVETIEKTSAEVMRIAGKKRYRIWSIYLAGCVLAIFLIIVISAKLGRVKLNAQHKGGRTCVPYMLNRLPTLAAIKAIPLKSDTK